MGQHLSTQTSPSADATTVKLSLSKRDSRQGTPFTQPTITNPPGMTRTASWSIPMNRQPHSRKASQP
jgi:hypothetical protein